jgi:hypothetical protein
MERSMRSSRWHIIVITIISAAQAGCGTLHNLNAPAECDPPTQIGAGTGRCIPFGGVARSGLLGIGGTPAGIGEVIRGQITIAEGGDPSAGLKSIGTGLWLTGCGLVALADTPVSLAGDLVTWPIAYARQQQQPWASWWGNGHGTCWLNLLWSKTPPSDEKSQIPDKDTQQSR